MLMMLRQGPLGLQPRPADAHDALRSWLACDWCQGLPPGPSQLTPAAVREPHCKLGSHF